ncbi:SusC/RagA family TonB-linked outer membrane protein [Chitinophaga sp.]|uniref:SusC/RagA family TonB-linked outer membrane protein n=1 Tax=Chitinophaga sp. TaxID=1869181 RepID=UPI002605DCFF|nr:SusC/RagA family TonB-linked outer membrane protein [uncultured Chitinophaga sp.]
MKRSLLLIAVLLAVACQQVYAQAKKTVTGTVNDAKGGYLPGVTVSEKGTKNGGVTDMNGNFTIKVDPNATLVFSFVGYVKKEVSVASRTTVAVSLEEDNQALSEVVVTGFGQKKSTRKITYSIAEVKGEDLVRANNSNLLNALSGKVSGVFVNMGNSGPMSSSTIRIRGNATLSANSQPLVVIDGVILEPGVTGGDSWGNSQDFGNQYKNLNPEDYESVTVLKGSAASALYGSQAQNGVLLITTKKGRAQKGLGVRVSHTESFDKAYKAVATQNEFGAGINPTFSKDADGVDQVDAANYFWSFGPRFNGQKVKDIDGRMIDWTAKPNNLLDAFSTGKFVNTNVAVEGGSDRNTYRVSYNNLYNTYITPGTWLKRNNFAVRATQKVSNFINLDANVQYTVTNSKNPLAQGSGNNPVFAMVYFNPRNYDTKYWMNNYLDSTGGVNRNDPYALNYLWFDREYTDMRQLEKTLLANLDVTANIRPWLNLLVRANINDANTERETKNWGRGLGFTGDAGKYEVYQVARRNTRFQALLTADKQLNEDLELSLSAGGESQRFEPARFSRAYTNGGLKTPGLFFLGNSVNAVGSDAGIENPGLFSSSKRIDAIYLYGDLTYKNMLTLNFSARNDWNSTLLYPKTGEGDYSYFYPSVGLSYIFTESLKGLDAMKWLSYGKLRASYAHTGQGVNPWQTSVGYYRFIGNYNYPGAAFGRYGFEGSTLGSLKIKPMTTKEWEFGTDVRFLNNRIGVDFTWYKKNTIDQLLPLPAPVESGVSSEFINAGNIQNKGIEVLLTLVPFRTKDFEWNATINYTRNRNKILELAEGVASFPLEMAFGADMTSVARPGKDYGTIITGYSYAEYQAKNADGSNKSHANNGKKLLRRNGSYARRSEVGQPDKELGSMMENYLFGTTHTLRYKNFMLGFQIDGKIGGLMASATHQYGSTNGSLLSTLPGRSAAFGGVTRKTYDPATGAVTGTFDDGIVPDGVFPDGTTFKPLANPQGADIDVSGLTYAEAMKLGVVEPVSARIYYARLTQWSTGIREYSTFENSWVSLREVTLGYNLPQSLAAKMKVQNLRVSVTGRNLTYLYKTTKDDIFPEGGFLSNRNATFAEYGGLPYVRSFGAKLDVAF